MKLKFYLDTHIDKQVALQLRKHGVDVVRCEEVGMAEAVDEAHLGYATTHQRVLVTKDSDFIELHGRWQALEQKHSGIFFCPHREKPTVGLLVQTCLDYAEAIEIGAGTYTDDIENRLYYVT